MLVDEMTFEYQKNNNNKKTNIEKQNKTKKNKSEENNVVVTLVFKILIHFTSKGSKERERDIERTNRVTMRREENVLCF